MQRYDTIDDESHGVGSLAGIDAKGGVEPPSGVLGEARVLSVRLGAEGVDDLEQPETAVKHGVNLTGVGDE